ncbi:hypothetical protein M569_08926 [Genlisea aurea]|uniref:Rubisco accumulation factor 1 C-terminal domain-containing protein n=1 Tax=Genlisea aurea TaxID=192259 RepID=S8DRZ4_9LAMI|nr:hypothetical protein M569_08926 [Genlisea aurea]
MVAIAVNNLNPIFFPNHQAPPRPLSVSALILPPSFSTSHKQKQQQQQQQLYQPFKPPPSSTRPSRFRSLDAAQKIDLLSNRSGLWFEYAPLIPLLVQDGFISSTIEELTGILAVEQNRLVVAAQVRDSLLESTDDETVSFFDSPGSPEILYEIRILNTPQRAAAARFIIANGFEPKQASELAKSMKDFPRRYGDKGWESFDGNSPGDCLAFMYFRQAQEYKSAHSSELSKASLHKALEFAETERAQNKITDDLHGKEAGVAGDTKTDADPYNFVRVPVVRMAMGEVAESRIVAVLPVCKGAAEVAAAPWECVGGGDFGVLHAERGWSRWVALPGWAPVAGLKRGGVAVMFPNARGILPVRNGEESVLAVVDRRVKGVQSEDEFYLVAGAGEDGLTVERGRKLKETGVFETLGTVVLVVRPPREEEEDSNGHHIVE